MSLEVWKSKPCWLLEGTASTAVSWLLFWLNPHPLHRLESGKAVKVLSCVTQRLKQEENNGLHGDPERLEMSGEMMVVARDWLFQWRLWVIDADKIVHTRVRSPGRKSHCTFPNGQMAAPCKHREALVTDQVLGRAFPLSLFCPAPLPSFPGTEGCPRRNIPSLDTSGSGVKSTSEKQMDLLTLQHSSNQEH